jgi:hypothetical protein
MKRNVGKTDKIIRVIIAALIAILYIADVISGTLGIVLLAFALVLIVTSFISFCGLYTLFGINTCKVKQ